MRSVAEEPSGKECNDLISCPLEKYHSLLRYFRSYRYMWMSFCKGLFTQRWGTPDR